MYWVWKWLKKCFIGTIQFLQHKASFTEMLYSNENPKKMKSTQATKMQDIWSFFVLFLANKRKWPNEKYHHLIFAKCDTPWTVQGKVHSESFFTLLQTFPREDSCSSHLLISSMNTSFLSPNLRKCHLHLWYNFPTSGQQEDKLIPFLASQRRKQDVEIDVET